MLYTIEGTSTTPSSYSWQSNSSNFLKINKLKTISESDCLFLQKIQLLVEKNVNNMNFGNKELAKNMHLSVSQLFRKIKMLTKRSTSNYMRGIRLKFAMEMLRNTNFTINEIAFRTGFNDPSYFIRTFVKEFGTTPGKVRKNQQ